MRLGITSADDLALAEKVEHWIARSVDCILGRREFSQGRYCVAVVGNADEMRQANQDFLLALKSGAVSSCYYAYRWSAAAATLKAGTDAVLLLHALLPWQVCSQGESVSQSVELICPVTQVPTLFDDFDMVGFYPHARNPDDPLYDPSNMSPFVGVNQASDVYGFACFAADLAKATLDDGLASLAEPSMREALFGKAKRMWNDMAARTFQRISAKTDPERLCPAHVTKDGQHYMTAHNESAFVETTKVVHRSEMPVVYLDRMIAQWEGWFRFGRQPDLSGVIPAAVPLHACPMHQLNARSRDAELKERGMAMA